MQAAQRQHLLGTFFWLFPVTVMDSPRKKANEADANAGGRGEIRGGDARRTDWSRQIICNADAARKGRLLCVWFHLFQEHSMIYDS